MRFRLKRQLRAFDLIIEQTQALSTALGKYHIFHVWCRSIWSIHTVRQSISWRGTIIVCPAQQLLNDTASVMCHPHNKFYVLTLRTSAAGTLLYCSCATVCAPLICCCNGKPDQSFHKEVLINAALCFCNFTKYPASPAVGLKESKY